MTRRRRTLGCLSRRVQAPALCSRDWWVLRDNWTFKSGQKKVSKARFITQYGYGAGHQHGEQPYGCNFEANESFRWYVSRAEGISDAYVSSKRYEAHVHYACGAGEDVARHVYVAPDNTKRPITWNTIIEGSGCYWFVWWFSPRKWQRANFTIIRSSYQRDSFRHFTHVEKNVWLIFANVVRNNFQKSMRLNQWVRIQSNDENRINESLNLLRT